MPDENDPDSVPEEIERAWETVVGLRLPVEHTRGEPLSGQEEVRLEGTLHAPGHIIARCGPLVTSIKCSDSTEWVIDYDEQSPYHAFAGRRVVVTGFPCEPPLQHVIGVTGHFAVSLMRLAKGRGGAWLTEIGPGQTLTGCFKGAMRNVGQSPLSFVTEIGDTFQVVNNPAGVIIGCTVQALCYPVQLSPRVAKTHQPYFWVICPWAYAELWELRERPDAGLPPDVYVDADSGQVRHRRGSTKPDETEN